MKNINRFLAAAMLAGFPAFAPEALAQKKRVCVELIDGGALMRVRIAAEESKYNTKWSKVTAIGGTRCVAVPRMPEDMEYWAEIKPVVAWGNKLISKCPSGAGKRYASSNIGKTICTSFFWTPYP